MFVSRYAFIYVLLFVDLHVDSFRFDMTTHCHSEEPVLSVVNLNYPSLPINEVTGFRTISLSGVYYGFNVIIQL